MTREAIGVRSGEHHRSGQDHREEKREADLNEVDASSADEVARGENERDEVEVHEDDGQEEEDGEALGSLDDFGARLAGEVDDEADAEEDPDAGDSEHHGDPCGRFWHKGVPSDRIQVQAGWAMLTADWVVEHRRHIETQESVRVFADVLAVPTDDVPGFGDAGNQVREVRPAAGGHGHYGLHQADGGGVFVGRRAITKRRHELRGFVKGLLNGVDVFDVGMGT